MTLGDAIAVVNLRSASTVLGFGLVKVLWYVWTVRFAKLLLVFCVADEKFILPAGTSFSLGADVLIAGLTTDVLVLSVNDDMHFPGSSKHAVNIDVGGLVGKPNPLLTFNVSKDVLMCDRDAANALLVLGSFWHRECFAPDGEQSSRNALRFTTSRICVVVVFPMSFV